MTAMPPLEPPPKGATQSRLKRWAFRQGCRSIVGGEDNIDRFMSYIHDLPPEQRKELMDMFQNGVRRGRDPYLPERAAEVVRWYERRHGAISTRHKLGRSKAYPRLLMMAFAMGMDGKAFAFARHRIANALGVTTTSVRHFIEVALREGLIDVVRDGIPGTDGQPAWFRLHMDNVKEELHIDRLHIGLENQIANVMDGYEPHT